ncbi:MAG: 2-C-methyl-D-erythritol 2,4-cyclodiphosphate synthase [Spirochaetota bacterium]
MYRIGSGYDSHRFIEGRPLILGGVTIPSDRGLDGHSDADALLHAVIDALLGAMGENDIGTLFPDTDPSLKGISSMVLLARVIERMRMKGFALVNIDATVVCEKPRLKDFIPEIRSTIARAFGRSTADVTVKAKSNEQMDDVGSGAGVMVFAVACLSKG